MDIPGLNTFINKNFTGWNKVNVQDWDHVVIDGKSVCAMLYRKTLPWALGGEYDKFSKVVEDFFTESRFNNPMVVWDGAEADQSKLDTVCKRREQAMAKMLEVQSASG